MQREIAQIGRVTHVGHGDIEIDAALWGHLDWILHRDTLATGVFKQDFHRFELHFARFHAQPQGVGQAPQAHRLGNLDVGIARRCPGEIYLKTVAERCNHLVLASALGHRPGIRVDGSVLDGGYPVLGILNAHQQRVGQQGMAGADKGLSVGHSSDDPLIIDGADTLIHRAPRHHTRVHLVQSVAAHAVDVDAVGMVLVDDHAVAHQLPLRLHDGDGLGGSNAVIVGIQVTRGRC